MASTLGKTNPLRYRGYVYDEETGLYYLQSRYYDPEMGRFINSDVFVSTGQGFIGNNMFAYCLNNPCIYYDDLGKQATRIDLTDADKDGNGIPDEPAGADAGGGSSSSGNPSGVQIVCGGSGKTVVVVENPNDEKTEVHHIVEQCQRDKSGFSNEMIQESGNKVSVPYSLHRKISGHYSSKPNFTNGLRVRDYLAGRSFEEQYLYGLDIIDRYWGELYG